MVDFTKYCIIIPAFNSQQHLPELINRIKKLYPELFIYVINDGSTDDTLAAIPKREKLMVFSHFKNRGKGAALKTGILKAQQQNFQYALFMDADLQHAPEKIIDFIETKEIKNADMVLGKRQFRLGKMPFIRILSNLITSHLISWRCRKKIHDSQCGFRLMDIDGLKIEDYGYDGFQFESEFLIKTLDNNYRCTEVEIPTLYTNEKSSINHVYDTIKFIKLYLHSFFWK